MTARVMLASVFATLCLLSGCTGRDAPVSQGNQAAEKRLVAIEAQLAAMGEELKARGGQPEPSATVAPTPTSPSSEDERVQRLEQLVAALTQNMDAIVDSRIDARIGTADDIQQIFEETVTEELEQAEARKKAEAKQRSEEMRRKWAERRKVQEQERLDKMVTELGLNVWQKDRVQAIVAESREAREGLSKKAREGGSFDGKFYRKGTEEIRAGTKKSLDEVLSVEQMEAFEKTGYGRHAMGGPVIITSKSITTDGAQSFQIDLSGQ